MKYRNKSPPKPRDESGGRKEGYSRRRAAIERTLLRAKAGALIAASTHEECLLARRTLKVGVCDGGKGMAGSFSLCTAQSEGSPHVLVDHISQFWLAFMGGGKEEETSSG